MGWPKGMPRKGHVNKDGSSHAKWGQKTSARNTEPENTQPVKRRRGRPKKGEDTGIERWDTKLVNKGVERCPRCQFPEAYAGYCNECGWQAPFNYGRQT